MSIKEVLISIRKANDKVYSDDSYDIMAKAMTLMQLEKLRILFIRNFMREFHNCKRILDIGAGNGSMTLELIRRYRAQYVLLDISITGLKKALKKLPSTLSDFVVASAEYLPFRRSSINAVYTTFALRQIVLEKLIPNVKYVLKSNGVFGVLDFWLPSNLLGKIILHVFTTFIVPLEALVITPRNIKEYAIVRKSIKYIPEAQDLVKIFKKFFTKVNVVFKVLGIFIILISTL